MSILVPLGMALFHASNSQFLHLAARQRHFARMSSLKDHEPIDEKKAQEVVNSRWKRIMNGMERADNIELKKLTEYRPETMTRDEQRDMNRQIFLNLPKTPTTPWGRDASNPMTPRTVAFTQLNGGQSAETAAGPSNQKASSGQGPSRLLPFREHYGGGGGPDGS